MFDEYEPVPPVSCPWCGGEVVSWQGSDGPNLLLLWQQGSAHPVDQRVDADVAMDRARYGEFTLPETFSITGHCRNDHLIDANCGCHEGVWTSVDLSTELAKVEEKRASDRRRQPRA